MALALASPCGVLSDDDEWLAVLESTAADQGGLMPRHHPEISVIKPAVVAQAPAGPAVLPKAELDRGGSGDEGVDKLKVYLRVRPLTEAEKERGEEQGCVAVQTEEILLLKAPKHSHNMKSAERGVAQSMHKFSFTKILGPQTKQQDVYDQTMREMVRDVLRGENRLLYTYGVTNSGKTYTVQGAGGEAGLLPRALVSVFLKLSGRLYPAMDLKPVLSQEIRRLDAGEVRAEEIRRDALLKEEEAGSSKRPRGGPSTSWDSGIGGLSATSHIATQLEDTDGVGLEAEGLSLSGGEELVEGTQFSVWVSFYEIYNEFLYDLLEAPPSLQQRKRATLRLSDDKHGNTYVKDLTWIQVRSAEEAWRVLKAGQRNQSFASTHLNHNSSRSHSIFTIRVLHIKPEECQGQGQHISELSVCDLAGSERCKDQNGERRKEANNINTSLLTLGRCINALRFNQTNRARPAQVVPFRDSKLTRVLQGFFCGRGRSCMVVNINPCASTYDETLQALKFSAIATQLVHGPSTKTRVAYILSLLREQQAHENDSTLLEDEEEEEDGDDEGDITMFDPEELLKAIEVLKREVLRQRQEKEANESAVREQVWTEMMEVVNSMQDDFSEALENDRALMEERCENRIKNLKSSLKKYYIQEIEERDEEIGRLNAALAEREVGEVTPAPIFPPLGETEGPRRSRRIASSHGHESKQPHAETELLKVQLEQCQTELDLKHAELQLKTLELKRLQDQQTVSATPNTMTSTAERKLEEGQRNVRQLRADLQRLGLELQSGERACCRNTDGEKLRHALSAADSTLAKQDQMLVELYTSLQLVKADLRKKTESLALLHTSRALPPPSTPIGVTLGGSCKKRGCGPENQPPEKRPFLRSLFGSRTPGSQTRRRPDPVTPYASVLRTRQPSPQPSPMLERRGRAKY